MDLPITFNKHPMLYKFKNDWNKNSKWLLTRKVRQKCVHEKELKT